MKRARRSKPNLPDFSVTESYSQKDIYWPVDRWDDDLAKAQPLLDLADEYRILRVPLMGQQVKERGAPTDLCGRTSSGMVHNFWQLCQNPNDPEPHYIKMWKTIDKDSKTEKSWNLRDPNRAKSKNPKSAISSFWTGSDYLVGNFGDIGDEVVAKRSSPQWIKDQCLPLVDSIKLNSPAIIYTRFSNRIQHIITLAGYALLGGELWFLVLDPESLEKDAGRILVGMYSVVDCPAAPQRSDLKSLNTKDVIRILAGDMNHALGAIYLMKAAHFFDTHCHQPKHFYFQSTEDTTHTRGQFLYRANKPPSISVPDELVVASGAPKVTPPVPAHAVRNLQALIASVISSLRDILAPAKHLPPAPPLPKPAEPLTRPQMLDHGPKTKEKIRHHVEMQKQPTADHIQTGRKQVHPYHGLFPIGSQGSWHSGIHVGCEREGSIHCYCDGVVVAARLPEKDPAKPKFGSRNFVLVRHETPDGAPYWSLYMHLRPLSLTESDTALQLAMPWLYQLTLTKIQEGQTILHSSHDLQGAKVRDVAEGEVFSVLDHQSAGGRFWYQVHSPADGAQGWIAKTERVSCAMGIPELQQLQKGDVVALNRRIRYATCVGFGDPACPVGDASYMHWEIFSKDPLPGGWKEIRDAETIDRQWLNDPDLLKRILNRNGMGTYLEPLEPSTIVHTSIEPLDENGKVLSGCAVQFVNEWAIDWAKAVDEGKLHPVKKDVVAQDFQPYSFWKDAVAAGVADLPADGKVWHYNPGEVLTRLHPAPTAPQVKTIPELAAALKTNWLDPHGLPYKDQNAHDVLIQTAAMKHGLEPLFLKSLVAQESKFVAHASNDGGYAGLTQLGLEEAKHHGLSTGSTDKASGMWIYDPADERFDPAKSLNGGAAHYLEGRDTVGRSVFQHFEEEVPEDQYDKFGLAVYNLGSSTLSRAHELAREAGKTNAAWEDLIEGETESFLCRGMPHDFNKAVKYREGTEFVAQILQRVSDE
jgi:hypothetical protein